MGTSSPPTVWSIQGGRCRLPTMAYLSYGAILKRKMNMRDIGVSGSISTLVHFVYALGRMPRKTYNKDATMFIHQDYV